MQRRRFLYTVVGGASLTAGCIGSDSEGQSSPTATEQTATDSSTTTGRPTQTTTTETATERTTRTETPIQPTTTATATKTETSTQTKTTERIATERSANTTVNPESRTSNQNENSSLADNTNSAGSWPQIGYDSRNTRHIPDARGPRDGATIAWRSLGDRPVYPPVADDALYLTEAWTGGAAFALGTEDGTEQWENTDLPPSRWAPALHEDRLLVITREEGNVVRLHALDTATGEQVWVREEGITASSTERPPISPTVRDGSIYISSNRGIIACEAATGEIEWTATLGRDIVEIDNGPTRLTVWTKPAVTANRVFTFDTNDSYQSTREVYAVDRKNGDRQWTAELEVGDRWYLKNYPVVGSDRIFISAVKAVSGGGDSGGGGSKGTGNDSEWEGGEQLFALDTESGAVAWDWELPRKTLSPPAYANGVLYVGEWYPDADTGRLHALDVRDGEILWTYRTETGAVLSPTVAEDTVYIHQDKKLAAVATADGTRRWQLEIGEWIGPPVIVGDIVYLQTNPGHSSDSQLMAIREP